MALFQRAATMFTPLKPSGNAAHDAGDEGNAAGHEFSSAMTHADTSAEIKALSDKIEDLQKQICALVEARAPKD
jgi:hypothetical protein